jgi:sec-independent protein translocase protein TatC
MALPMYIFYEVGIVSAGIFNKKKALEPGASLVPVVAAAGPGVVKTGPSVSSSGGGDSEYVGVPTGRRG